MLPCLPALLRPACAAALAASLLTACAGEVVEAGERVSRGEYGQAWPFTVYSGELRCKGTIGARSALFVADGTTYALNARAEGRGDGEPLAPIWATTGEDPPLRKDVRPLLDRALDLCDPDLPRT